MAMVWLARRCHGAAVGGLLILVAAGLAWAGDAGWELCETAQLERGELKVLFRDNSRSPGVLSGASALFNRRHAEGFDAFDPDSPGASAGLNFEHVIAGHGSPNNLFIPRHHKYALYRAVGQPAVRLVRDQKDDPWRLASTLTYSLVEPNCIDFDFRCRAHDPRLFGERGYAVLFFANYQNDVEQVALNFLGKVAPQGDERWIAADAPPGHPDYNGGGTYRAAELGRP
jgi:hypothetical protein